MNDILSICYGDRKICTCLVQNQTIGGGLHGVVFVLCEWWLSSQQRRKKCGDVGNMQQPKELDMCFFYEDCCVHKRET